MLIGFTGTQLGMTLRQKDHLQRLMRLLHGEYSLHEFHHGDCIGADAEAHLIVCDVLGSDRIIKHPPIKNSKRAFCVGGQELPARNYLDRNHDIVDAVKILIAAPNSMHEERRSGTWSTVRYARTKLVSVLILQP